MVTIANFFKADSTATTLVKPMIATNEFSSNKTEKKTPILQPATNKTNGNDSKVYGIVTRPIGIGLPAGEYTTPTISGGFQEEVFNGDYELVKVTRVDKNGDNVETEKLEYKKDENGKVISRTSTYYDNKNKKCGSCETFENGDVIYRGKDGKVLCKLIYDSETCSYRYVDANGKTISMKEAGKLITSVHPQDKKYKNFEKDEANAIYEDCKKLNAKA